MGRSDDLTEFVKRSTEKNILSFCEVDLLRNDTIITIRRILNDETQSSKWMIDGKTSTQKQVKLIMSQMNIDVDNLCSFMPQDKVGTFTQQSAKGILHKTLECIKVNGERNLHEEQMELAEEQSGARDRGLEMENQQSTVETLRHQLNAMKSEVERIEQRAAVEHRLKLFEIKLLIMGLQECGQAVQQQQVGSTRPVVSWASDNVFVWRLLDRNWWTPWWPSWPRRSKICGPWRCGTGGHGSTGYLRA